MLFYTVRMEEPYLERVFVEEYVLYKASTPSYIGIPRPLNENIPDLATEQESRCTS
ncbi:MAG: hypothetical protein ACTSW8_08075 [Candidatus Thorarchaeota archaeon]